MSESTESVPERIAHHATLWVNDAPDEYRGNGEFHDGPFPHGHVYHAEQHRHVVQATFVAMNGRAMRVSFDPETGDATVNDITEAQRP